ncbi:MAG: 1-acyl-sn-glycerol-3-phosphate acyltransferase [Armatimonadetes bacterium]|nr:1-acyl-sn-glycerol-3-phosphate acyltransferase [Armatimonadota bacterium]
MFNRLVASFLAGVARVITGATATWIHCLPDTRQRVYFANHSSHLDFAVLWCVLPGQVRAVTRPVAAKDYWTCGKLRPYLARDVFNSVLVERQTASIEDRKRQIRVLLEGLGDRYSLILFPEGTRGTGEVIAPFKSGLYYLARQAPRVELVPVYLDNLNRILPKGQFLPVPLLGRVLFGTPMQLGEGETKAEFLVRARGAVVALGEL